MKQLFVTALSLFLLTTGFAFPAERETLSLDGTWHFATDPAGVGEAEQWFAPGKQLPKMPLEGYAKTADGTIRVPGCWDAQGYGTETDKVKHNFIGKGWYKKTVRIPERWNGEKIFLTVTGIARYAKVWIDGVSVGPEAVGCVSIHEWDVTPLIKPGKEIDVTICVDSKQRYEIDALFGCAQLADYMDIVWGGIWGHVRLEARPTVRLDDLLIRTKIDGTCTARLAVLRDDSAADCNALTFEVFDAASKKSVAKTTVPLTGDRKLTAARTPLTVDVRVPKPKLWSPDATNLYHAKISLQKDNLIVDTIQTRFGIREFRIDGSDLLLNGKKLMLTGYGDDHIYPQEWSLSSDKEMYLKRLRIIRSYGFNFVRHHSTTMPPEYYEACDETGVIPMVEFLIVYQPFMPGEPTWLSQVPQGTSTEPAMKTYLERWEAVVKQYRNHPSILCWIMGNELGGPLPQFAQLRRDFYRIAKEHDLDRFFLDTDGGDWKGYFDDPKNDRDTLDFVSYQFDEWTSPVLNPAKFTLPKQRKPTLSHEAGNYITFTRPNEIDMYKTSNFKPFWMTGG
jgi:beta-galactosidase/beta-glucuronidase